MESTFKLHPLPQVVLEALQAASSKEECPEGMEIVGGLTEVGIRKISRTTRSQNNRA
jgi:hypothetical protein